MPSGVEMAFDPKGVMLPVVQILPARTVRPDMRKGPQYQRLFASIREIGVIEPLIVYPQKPAGGEPRFMLLDGHLRLDVLKELGRPEAFCLISRDDEAFTYNHRVNRIAPIQEHFMILRAIESGVSEERIAATLSVNVAAVRAKRDLLSGICPEAVTLLKNKKITPGGLREIKRVLPMRQIEMAELMTAANNFSSSYARCLIAATPDKLRAEGEKPKSTPGMKPEDLARMEREMEVLEREFLAIQDSLGPNTLHLSVAVAYVRKLLEHPNVVKYLARHHSDILGEFERLLESPDLKVA